MDKEPSLDNLIYKSEARIFKEELFNQMLEYFDWLIQNKIITESEAKAIILVNFVGKDIKKIGKILFRCDRTIETHVQDGRKKIKEYYSLNSQYIIILLYNLMSKGVNIKNQSVFKIFTLK